MMDSPPKRTGETLIVHHIPLVHCQLSGSHQRCGSPLRKSNNLFSCPENLGLIRTTSLPERDVLQREALVYSSLIQTSSSSDAFEDDGMREEKNKGLRGGSMASDTSSFTSSNSEDALPKVLSTEERNRPSSLRHNPFLMNVGDDDYLDVEDDDDDENNLNGYLEDSSFHLHGNSNAALDDGVDFAPFHLHELGYNSGPFNLHESLTKPWSSDQTGAPPGRHVSAHLEGSDLLGLDVQHRHGSSGSTLSMDCGEQEWEDDDDDQSMQGNRGSSGCCGCSRTYPGSFPDFAHGYCSDSSCNSSDGILVNFSTIYNKTNNIVADKPVNLNSSADQSCTSSVSEPVCMGGAEYGSGGGAFYLDLHRSPTEAPEEAVDLRSSCLCISQPQSGTVELDANCNSYHNHKGLLPSESSANDLTSCMQSQARLVVATQNYYKLVTCDVSAHSSPSPVGSSVTSCSDEHSKGSPAQPTEYFLFRYTKEQEEKEEQGGNAEVNTPKTCDTNAEAPVSDADSKQANVIEGQVHVNISPPVGGVAVGARLRSRSYDRNLDKTPQSRLGSLERMLSCPVRLSEGSTPEPSQPPRVTSFAEIARNKKKNGGSPSQKSSAEASSVHSRSSGEFSPILEALSSMMSSPHWSVPPRASPGGTARETRTKAEGGLSGSGDSSPAVVRYSKDQRPTSLPIQPFTLQQQFGKPQAKPVLPLLDEYIIHMQSRLGSAPSEQDEEDSDEDGQPSRPSPLGSYSPLRSLSCPAPLSHTPPGVAPATKVTTLPPTPPPTSRQHCFPRVSRTTLPTLPSSGISPMAQLEAEQQQEEEMNVPAVCTTQRAHYAHHLSPQALKWREYRRKNPLGVEKHRDACSSSSCLSASAAGRRAARRNVFDFPPSHQALNFSRITGHSVRCYSDLLPDYFSQTERPPEEFCLSPDATTEESISIDLHQKRGLVKAINTAVDLIVAHFSTSRDAGVKAKLGNSSVSPNVAHLILKYLCPAVCDVLQDGLRSYTLDIIIGQRRNRPWSVVEASTQLGPSTRVLHSLFLKVSQYSELTNHSMRLNAFILGLLNSQSLEYWFNHIYTHEDMIVAHYYQWGFLTLSQGACQPMFEELLLLLQPLSLLPFDLDLLFEPRQLQKGQEHLKHKEQLCSTRQNLDQSARSTLQLMRGPSEHLQLKAAESNRKGAELYRGRFLLRREGSWPRMDGAESKKQVQRSDRAESERLILHSGRTNGVGREDEERERRREREREKDGQRDRLRGKQAGWWFQLMQSSQVYIENSAEGSKFIKWEKRRKGSGAEGRRQNNPPPRVGVVEGAEAHHVTDEIPESTRCEDTRHSAGTFPQSKPSKSIKGKPSWMGSPPESVLRELKTTKETQSEGAEPETHAAPNLRWGRLFGAVGKTERTEPKTSKNPRCRLPSAWFSLDRSVLDRVVQSVGKRAELQALNTHRADIQDSQTQQDRKKEVDTQTAAICEVRALCHHIATETGHLSFHKGDVLQVLSRADSDWLLCALGDAQGLVPIIYVTLNDEEEENPRGPE